LFCQQDLGRAGANLLLIQTINQILFYANTSIATQTPDTKNAPNYIDHKQVRKLVQTYTTDKHKSEQTIMYANTNP